MPLLFSYGTLQLEQVQLETFGRLLKGEKDILEDYQLTMIEITGPEGLRKSNQRFHPIISFSGDKKDQEEGEHFEVTEEEILLADEYEVDDYKRVEVTFKSGKNGYIYIGK